MMRVVLASGNAGKLFEIRQHWINVPVELLNLQDFPGCPISEESYETYLENARDKARLTAEFSGLWALAEDSGLEVFALGGRPGVRSARYAGLGLPSERHLLKLLEELREVPAEKRRARFCCTMVLRSPQGEEYVTRGELPGWIAEAPSGRGVFGYDPVFQTEWGGETLAQWDVNAKNRVSHRARALDEMLQVLQRLTKPGKE